MRILLIAGGWSSERTVSLAGARNIRESLERLGHDVVFLDPFERFAELLDEAAKADFAFLNLHGSPGEDGLVQAMLDQVGCPYQGSGPRGSFLALHKAAAKAVFRSGGLPTADWVFLPTRPAPDWKLPLPLPVFVKPNLGGSSLGMSLVRQESELAPALDKVFSEGGEALIETYVQGLEVTCAVLGDTPLPPILIRPAKSSDFFDYTSKYAPDGAEEICPAPISRELTALVQDLALKAHRLLGLDGYSRTDFIARGNEAVVLEVNTLPGMTGTSLVPKAAAAAGMSFDDLIRRLTDLGLESRSSRQAREALG